MPPAPPTASTHGAAPWTTETSQELAPYAFAVEPFLPGHFRVLRARGREPEGKPYRFDVMVTTTTLASLDLERACVGRRAALAIRVGGSPRVVAGVIESVRCGARSSTGSAQLQFKLVPALTLLRQRHGPRVFRNATVQNVVATVLDAHGVAARWQTTHASPVRPAITQGDESDFTFVTRLLAETRVAYSFVSSTEGLRGFLDAARTGITTPIEPRAVSLDPTDRLPTEIIVFRDDVAEASPPTERERDALWLLPVR